MLILASGSFAPAASAQAGKGVFEPEFESSEYYGESFTIVADLDNGAYVQIQLTFSNAGLGDGKGLCRMLYVPSEGSAITGSKRFDRDEWSHSQADQRSTLTVGPCRLAGGPSATHVEAKLGDTRLALSIESKAKRVRPPNSAVEVEDGFWKYNVLIPRARAIGELETKGRTTALQGWTFVDQARSTALPGDIATSWVRYRGLKGDAPALVLVRRTPEGEARGFIWRLGGSAPEALAAMTLDVPNDRSTSTPRTVTVGGQKIVTERKLYRFAPLEEYSFFRFIAGAVVGNPVTRTFRATSDAPNRGILEIQHVDD